MIRHLIPCAMSLSCAIAFAATPGETVTAFHTALKKGDADAVKAMLKPGVQIFESGYVERSSDEYALHHLASDIAFARETDERILREQEQVGGNLAVVIRETETRGKYRGMPVHLLGTETVVMEKHGGGWVLTHIHWSSRKTGE